MQVNDSSNGLVTEAQVYGLDTGIVASGLPGLRAYSRERFADAVSRLDTDDADALHHIGRAQALGDWSAGEGNSCWLCGVVVQFNLTAPRYFWHEWQRYHFQDIVSSTSTMHSLLPVLRKCQDAPDALKARFDRRTPDLLIEAFRQCAVSVLDDAGLADKEKIRRLKPMLPEGWLQTARITTNYRQLKTMIHQRKDHVLDEWHEFMDWCETLPLSDMLFSWRTEQ